MQAVKDSLLEKRAEIIKQAGKDFTKALNNRDVNAMKKAIENKAENINTPNKKGQTPLMQLLEDVGSSKSYICARALIPYADLGAKDNDGATVEDYAATIKTLKGQVIQREINSEKQARAKRAGEAKRDYEYSTFALSTGNYGEKKPVFEYTKITKTETGYDEVKYHSDGGMTTLSVKASPEEADKKIKEFNTLNSVPKIDNAINGINLEIQGIDEKTYIAVANEKDWDVKYGKYGVRKDIHGSGIWSFVDRSSVTGKVMDFFEKHLR